MAAPTVAGTNETTLAASSSHAVNLPGSIAAGDLLIILIGHAQAVTINSVTGWNELVDDGVANGVGVLWRRADGTEGATVTVGTSGSTKLVAISYRISGANNTSAPAISTVATGTTNAPDPTTCNPGTSKDRLWITFFVQAGEEADDDTWCNNVPGTPAGPPAYGTLLQVATGTGGLASTNCQIASAHRAATGSSEDVAWGSGTTDQSLGWRAHTIGIQAGGGMFQAGSYYKA